MEDFSAPQIQITLLFAASEQCCQAASFEYNNPNYVKPILQFNQSKVENYVGWYLFATVVMASLPHQELLLLSLTKNITVTVKVLIVMFNQVTNSLVMHSIHTVSVNIIYSYTTQYVYPFC